MASPPPEPIDARAWFDRLATGELDRRPRPGAVVVVDLDDLRSVPEPGASAGWPLIPVVAVGVVSGRGPDPTPATVSGAELCDVVLGADDLGALDDVVATTAANPVAAVALAQLLRGANGRADVADGLLVESALYSALQAGTGFARWRASRPPRRRPSTPGAEPVRLERRDRTLIVTLTRPEVRNALDAAMRDALVDAFRLVEADATIAAVELRGEGPAFCAGGDLDEFGTFADPASAHLLRLDRSVGWAIDRVADRVTAHLHGAAVGSGIELPAFAGTVVAHPNTRIALPEVGLGLIPGAGGTVSLTRRIGRHRTAWLALTGRTIDAATALSWGLVDRIAEAPAPTG